MPEILPMLFRRKKEKNSIKKDSFQQTIASLSSKIGTLTDQRLNFHSPVESLNAARTPSTPPPFFFFKRSRRGVELPKTPSASKKEWNYSKTNNSNCYRKRKRQGITEIDTFVAQEC